MLMRTDPFREMDRIVQQLSGTSGTWSKPSVMPMDAYRQGDTSVGGRVARELMLYNPREHRKVSLGTYSADPIFSGDIRCDLHPRWSPDDKLVTFDSVHEGTRQIYVVDVSAIICG